MSGTFFLINFNKNKAKRKLAVFTYNHLLTADKNSCILEVIAEYHYDKYFYS